MLGLRLFVVLIVAVGSVELAGCGGEAARSAQTTRAQASSIAADSGKDAGRPLLEARHARPLHKDAPHETFLSTYHNPEEGISFRYPQNYSLEEGDIEEHSFFLQRQEDLDSEQPGAKLLATVLIPEDGYPNTTFEHGSLQLAISEVESEKGCLAISEVGAAGTRALTVQGVAFLWSAEETEVAGSKILQRKYAGYSQGSCYQFRLLLAAEESLDPNGFTKNADMVRIMKQLESIVASSRVFAKSAPAPDEISKQTDRL